MSILLKCFFVLVFTLILYSKNVFWLPCLKKTELLAFSIWIWVTSPLQYTLYLQLISPLLTLFGIRNSALYFYFQKTFPHETKFPHSVQQTPIISCYVPVIILVMKRPSQLKKLMVQ